MLERQRYELLRSELRKARLESGILQKDLAKILRKPQSYISKVESGERNIDVIEFIAYCDAIGLDASKWLNKLIKRF
jgi:transcriptional regulator with XRE-family HTH domain